MVVVLYQNGCKKPAEQIAFDLRRAFGARISVSVYPARSPSPWTEPPSWDDLLVLLFDGSALPQNGIDYITRYQEIREDAGLLLPVAISPRSQVPPKPVHALKAMQYDPRSTGPHGQITQRIGAMLHLRLQGRHTKIFISHRSLDGARIAAQLNDHLASLAYRPWLDVARDLDGETQILPGSPVQNEIDTALSDASLMLLIDTPEAYKSLWIKHEVDTANGMMIPILPICFREAGDPAKGSRFQALRELQRYEMLPLPVTKRKSPLQAAQLSQIVHAAEEYLCEILQRRCRVPLVVKEIFRSKGYDWNILDAKRLMFRSQRNHRRIRTRVLSHCSIFDQIYSPALHGFREYLKSATWANFPLFIYDGAILPQSILDDIVNASSDDPVIVLNHQELAELVHSHFSTLNPSA